MLYFKESIKITALQDRFLKDNFYMNAKEFIQWMKEENVIDDYNTVCELAFACGITSNDEFKNNRAYGLFKYEYVYKRLEDLKEEIFFFMNVYDVLRAIVTDEYDELDNINLRRYYNDYVYEENINKRRYKQIKK